MTVAEMIAALNAFPQEARLIVDGYEGGYDDAQPPRECPININVNPQDYYGDHDDADEEDPDEIAVLISRRAD